MRAGALLVGLLLTAVLTGCLRAPAAGTNADLLGGPAAELVAEIISYFPGATGYLARPADGSNLPGVVMIHEWWGLNDHVRAMARSLAAEGYQVLAVDLYHGGVATTAEEARARMQALNQEEALQNLAAAADLLRDRGAARVASLGWCFGGGQSLRFGLSGLDLEAVVVYYGNVVTDEAQLRVLPPVLGIFADQDRGIPVREVRAFEQGLQRAGVPNEVHVYRGVGHGFANPSAATYAPVPTVDAWAKTTDFLARHLRPV